MQTLFLLHRYDGILLWKQIRPASYTSSASTTWHNGLWYQCMWRTLNKNSHGYKWLYVFLLSVHFYARGKRVLLFNAVFVPTMPLTLVINHLANRPNFICTPILRVFEGEPRNWISFQPLCLPAPPLFPRTFSFFLFFFFMSCSLFSVPPLLLLPYTHTIY